jgi:diguanylate cyclase (GGDEF)-like protein
MYISPILPFNRSSFSFKARESGGRLDRVNQPHEDKENAEESPKKVRTFINPYLSDYNKTATDDVIRSMYGNLFKIAYKDPRSRLGSRTALDRELPVVIKRLQEEGKPLTIAMFDMDNFKSVNEILGYTVGDEFISTIGNTIDDVVRPKDFMAYRYGGEEYMILFTGKTADEIKDIVEDIQNRINNNEKMHSFLNQYIKIGKQKIAELTEKQRPLQYLRSLTTSIMQARIKVDVYNGDLSIDEGVERIINTGDTLLTKEDRSITPEDIAQSRALQAYADGTKKRLIAIRSAKINGNTSVGEDLAAKVKNREETYKNTLLGLLEDMMGDADDKEKEFLSYYVRRLNKCKDLKEFEKCDNTALANYVAAHHDKSAQIANFKNWIAQVQRVQNGKMAGFTITSGIKQFEPDKKKSVEEYYEEVSAVLKNGKSKDKGGAYCEDGTNICSAGT